MLVFARFFKDAGLLNDFLEALQGAVQRLVGTYLYLRQKLYPLTWPNWKNGRCLV